jgi:hypothetical protein
MFKNNFLATGGEMQDIEIHDIQSERNVQSITGHETRYCKCTYIAAALFKIRHLEQTPFVVN